MTISGEIMILNYERLISSDRRRQSDVEEIRDINQESESDRGRFVFSSPLRRLQQKAQVYSLEDNAAVRSRLTHSLEVSQLGRYIAQLILKKLNSTSNELKLGGFKFEVQQFMVFLCTAFPRRRIPHAGFYNPAPFWGDD